MFDVEKIREDFPILSREISGRPLIYLDNGATSQTPKCVVDHIADTYYRVNANVHRGVHTLSQEATDAHEAARRRVQQFIGAGSSSEIIFTRGTTEAINLVASSFGDEFLHDGDEVILTVMEHHANIVPWQLLQRRRNIKLRVVPIDERGDLNVETYKSLFNEHTRLVGVAHVSNVLGTINPVREMIAYAHAQGVPVLVDGAQAVPHLRVNVQELDADFYVFSAHKVYGPTGIGVLYGKEKWLDAMPPYQGGGEMIAHVDFSGTTFGELDNKLAGRSVNEGFSGGEKKRNEIFQMAMLEPRLSILDETDSGLDIDALRIVAGGVNKLKSEKNATIVITHYQRLLDYIAPDFVHVLYKGRIVKSGGPELALELEERGYDWIKKELGEI